MSERKLHFYSAEYQGNSIKMMLNNEEKMTINVMNKTIVVFDLSSKNLDLLVYNFLSNEHHIGQFSLKNKHPNALFYFPADFGPEKLPVLLDSFKEYFLLVMREDPPDKKMKNLIEQTEEFFEKNPVPQPETLKWENKDPEDLLPKVFGFFLMTRRKTPLFRILNDVSIVDAVVTRLRDEITNNEQQSEYIKRLVELEKQLQCLCLISSHKINDSKHDEDLWKMINEEVERNNYRIDDGCILERILNKFRKKEVFDSLKIMRLSSNLRFTLQLLLECRPALESFKDVIERQDFKKITTEHEYLKSLIADVGRIYKSEELDRIIQQKIFLCIEDMNGLLSLGKAIFSDSATTVHRKAFVKETAARLSKRGLISLRKNPLKNVNKELRASINDQLTSFFSSRISFDEFTDLIELCRNTKDLSRACEDLKAGIMSIIARGEFAMLYVLIDLKDKATKEIFWRNFKSLERCDEKSARETLERLHFMLKWVEHQRNSKLNDCTGASWAEGGLKDCISFFRAQAPDRPLKVEMEILDIVQEGFYLYELEKGLEGKTIPSEKAQSFYLDHIKKLNELGPKEKERFLDVLRCPMRLRNLMFLLDKSLKISRKDRLKLINEFLREESRKEQCKKEYFVFILFEEGDLNKVSLCGSESGSIEEIGAAIADSDVSVGSYKITSEFQNIKLVINQFLTVEVKLEKKYIFVGLEKNAVHTNSSFLKERIFWKILLMAEASLRGMNFSPLRANAKKY